MAVTAVVAKGAPGVSVDDDWDGFGQRLTASGTARFAGGAVLDEDRTIFPYTLPFYQTVHLATLAGIACAASHDLSQAVAARRRGYTHGAAASPTQDPQVLEVVGRVRGAAYAAGAVVEKVAEAIERVVGALRAGRNFEPLLAVAEIESAQAMPVVSALVLDAATALFDALGASAVLRGQSLDRHWRDARTHSVHDPVRWMCAAIGDFWINDVAPPRHGAI